MIMLDTFLVGMLMIVGCLLIDVLVSEFVLTPKGGVYIGKVKLNFIH